MTGLRARRILSRIRTRTEVARARRRIVADLVEDAIRLERRIKGMDRDIEQAMGASSTLPEIYGCGYVTAARILGHVGDVTRFPTRAHFASYTGTAPIAASSGEVVRHRLSRAGDRQLNQALHLIALVQLRDDTPSRSYFHRKLAEGKTSREALRCLKRRVSDQVYRVMFADTRSAQLVSAPAT